MKEFISNEEIQAAFERSIDRDILKLRFVKKIDKEEDLEDYNDLADNVPFAYVRDENVYFYKNKEWNPRVEVVVNLMDRESRNIVRDMLAKKFGKDLKTTYSGSKKEIKSLVIG